MDNKTEQLSSALDQLNCGQKAKTSDPEVIELLAVAALLRNSDLPVEPPEHILSASIERAAAGLGEQQARRRSPWLYSGILGAAAALLVFFGIHGAPEIQDIAQQTMTVPASQQAPPAIATPATTTTAEKSATSESASPDAPRANPPAPQVTSPPAATSPAAPAPAPVQPAAKTERAAPSLKAARPPAFSTKNATPGELIALKLPGHTADSIKIDSASGSIRQVFNANSPQELVIIQRKLPAEQKDAAMQSEQQAATSATKNYSVGAASTGPNRLIIVINGQEVTLEGRQSSEELAALAKTLNP